jgi:hypothetical protein
MADERVPGTDLFDYLSLRFVICPLLPSLVRHQR